MTAINPVPSLIVILHHHPFYIRLQCILLTSLVSLSVGLSGFNANSMGERIFLISGDSVLSCHLDASGKPTGPAGSSSTTAADKEVTRLTHLNAIQKEILSELAGNSSSAAGRRTEGMKWQLCLRAATETQQFTASSAPTAYSPLSEPQGPHL